MDSRLDTVVGTVAEPGFDNCLLCTLGYRHQYFDRVLLVYIRTANS